MPVEGVACVVENRPIIQYLNVTHHGYSDAEKKERMITAFLATSIMHETAHVFGLDERYNDPEHEKISNGCVMSKLNSEDQDDILQSILSGETEPFCLDCKEQLAMLIEAYFAIDN